MLQVIVVYALFVPNPVMIYMYTNNYCDCDFNDLEVNTAWAVRYVYILRGLHACGSWPDRWIMYIMYLRYSRYQTVTSLVLR